jgi:5-methylcytosine-specific restriction protein A
MTTRRYAKPRYSGKGICRWCGEPVAPPRRSWCGDGCVEEYLSRSSSAGLRAAAYRRDRGVCGLCGCDTEKVKRVMRAAFSAYLETRFGTTKRADSSWRPGMFSMWSAARAADPVFQLFVSLGWTASRLQNDDSLWDADHIVPVVEGGGETGLENIRSLCLPCHKAETRELARRRAKARRDAKRALLP